MLKIIVVVCVAVVTLSNGKPIPENSKVTRIDIPNAITREQFVALAQYAMRIMASRINITLQATPSQNDSNRVRDSVQSTTPKDVKQVDQKLAQSEKLGVDSALTYEPFIRYPQLFPNQFGFDVIPNSQISSTYVPQTDETKKAQNNPFISNVKPVTYVDGEKDERLSNIRIKNLTIERIPSSQQGSPVVSVPFEAVITFSRQKQTSPSKLEVKDQDLVIPTRDPPDDFPPYFDTVLTVAKKTESNNSLISLNQENNLNPVTDRTNEVYADGKKQSMKPMGKRQTARLGDFLEMLGISTTGSRRGRKGAIRSPTPLLPVIEAPGNTSAQKASGVDREKTTTTTSTTTAKPQNGPTFQRQEIEEDDDDEEEGGSLGSVADLLPLILPVLEDLSDPNTETDIGELLEAGLPLVQGISQPDEDDEDPIDIPGILTPIIASLFGPNRNMNATVLQTILPSIVPLLTPFIGPLIGPIIQSSNNPPELGGSSITPIIQAFAGPLSLPTEPGGVPIASSLIAGVVSSLTRDLLKPAGNGGSDLSALVSTLVSGALAGGSAGLSGASGKQPGGQTSPARPAYAPYAQGPVPASSVDTLNLVGTSIKDIFGLSLQLVKSVISSVTGILGASSSEPQRPVYGPPNANYRGK